MSTVKITYDDLKVLGARAKENGRQDEFIDLVLEWCEHMEQSYSVMADDEGRSKAVLELDKLTKGLMGQDIEHEAIKETPVDAALKELSRLSYAVNVLKRAILDCEENKVSNQMSGFGTGYEHPDFNTLFKKAVFLASKRIEQ